MSLPVKPLSLEYSSPRERLVSMRLYYVSLWLGALPLIIGFAILFFYWLTNIEFFVQVGLFWLLIGGIIALIGFCISVAFLIQAHNSTVDRRRNIRRGFTCLVLALSNMPAALICAFVGIGLVTSPFIRFEIQNKGMKPIDDSYVTIGSQKIQFGGVKLDQMVTERTRVHGSGPMTVTVIRGSSQSVTEIINHVDEDVTMGRSKPWTITIDDDHATINW